MPTQDPHIRRHPMNAICITNTKDVLWRLLHCTHTKSTYSPTHRTQHMKTWWDMAQVVTSLQVPESKLRGTRWNPLLKAPKVDRRGSPTVWHIWGGLFRGERGSNWWRVITTLPPGTELPEHTHSISKAYSSLLCNATHMFQLHPTAPAFDLYSFLPLEDTYPVRT